MLGTSFRAIVDTAVDGIMLMDLLGVVTMFNPACERMFGYRAEEVLGVNVKVLMPAPYREEHDGYLANYRNTGERKIIGIGREVRGQRRNGATFPIELSVGEARSAASRFSLALSTTSPNAGAPTSSENCSSSI